MAYTINKLAQLAGVTTRTLRYYDTVGLLPPEYINASGYRIYGSQEVDRLQEILFYRQLGMSLEEIKAVLSEPKLSRIEKLGQHLTALKAQQQQLDVLIQNVESSIKVAKGERIMTDKEKFEGFKREMIVENEAKYGAEIREKYGEKVVDASNEKLKNMSKEAFDAAFGPALNASLKEALLSGDPAGELATKACDLHKEWLCFFWPEGMYTKELHLQMGEMYVADARFKAHYDEIADGLAEFLLEALRVYCG